MPVTFVAAIAAVPNVITVAARAISFVFTLVLPLIAAVHSAHEDTVTPQVDVKVKPLLTFKLT